MTMASEAKVGALGRCATYRGIPTDHLRTLAEMMEVELLDAGEVLFEQGETADLQYVVVEGELGVEVGGEQVRTIGPGEVLGEYGMFIGFQRTATVTAISGATLLSLDYPRFRAFLLQFPEATLVLMQTAVERLIAAEQRGSS